MSLNLPTVKALGRGLVGRYGGQVRGLTCVQWQVASYGWQSGGCQELVRPGSPG